MKQEPINLSIFWHSLINLFANYVFCTHCRVCCRFSWYYQP